MIITDTLYVDLDLAISQESFELERDISEPLVFDLGLDDTAFDMEADSLLDSYDMNLIENSVYSDFDLDTEIVIFGDPIEGEYYEGPYRVNPSFLDQTLLTKNKVMRQDVEVDKIQVSRVSNLQGGKTVYIGGVING
jgi:aminopeptidase C